MLQSAFLGAVLICFAGAALAQASAEVEHDPVDGQTCLSMQNEALRLACYDEAYGFEPAEISTAATTSGGWQFISQEDDFTNQDTSYVFLRSDRAGDAFSDAPSQLVVRCDGNGGTEIFVVANGYIGARNDVIPVRFRFGEDPPISERWNESTSGTAAFLPRGYQDFRAGLVSRQDFIFEITDYRGSRYSAEFDGLSENEDMLEHVLGGCQ